MQEYSSVNELLANAHFDRFELAQENVISQNVSVVEESGYEFIQWDFTLRNGQDIHFREAKHMLMQPKVLASCKSYILRTLPKAYSI